MPLRYCVSLIFLLGGTSSVAQISDPESLPDYRPMQNNSPNELRVISPTIAPEELDRVVLNRLLLEISRDPLRAQEVLGVDSHLLNEIQISLSNAASFINDNDMANVRAMCRAWDLSARDDLSENERIELALQAYKQRRQFTRDFIARFYRVVILEIESFLPAPARSRFQSYLDDRRRRMANAGNVVPGAIVENVSSGAETVRFHCRTD